MGSAGIYLPTAVAGLDERVVEGPVVAGFALGAFGGGLQVVEAEGYEHPAAREAVGVAYLKGGVVAGAGAVLELRERRLGLRLRRTLDP